MTFNTSGGLNGGLNSAYDDLRGQAGSNAAGQSQGYQSWGTGAQSVMNDQAGSFDALKSNTLSDMASGNMIGSGNEHFTKMLNEGADQIQARVGDAAAAAGRSGSSAHQNLLSDNLGSYYNNAYANQYNNDVSHMMGANSQMANLQGMANQAQQQGLNYEKSGLDSAYGSQNTGLGMQGNLLGAQVGAQQSGNQLALQAGQGLGNLFQAGLQPSQVMGQVGAAMDGQERMKLQDQIDKYYQNRDIGKTKAQFLNAIGSGAGQFGSSTSSVQQPGQSFGQQALGYGMLGASILGGF